MRFQFLNKTIHHKRFDYSPMYYDERKEKLKKKRDQFKRMESGEISNEERREILRDNLRMEYTRANYRQQKRGNSSTRVFLLVALIVALGYFVFNGVDQVDIIVKKLW